MAVRERRGFGGFSDGQARRGAGRAGIGGTEEHIPERSGLESPQKALDQPRHRCRFPDWQCLQRLEAMDLCRPLPCA